MPFVDENDCIGGKTRPVVVLVECNHEVFKQLGGNSLFNEQIYGTHAHFNRVPDPGPHGAYHREWCLDPEKPINTLKILADHPKFTLPRLRKWLASDGFVRSARRTLIASMGGETRWSAAKFNKAWCQRVRLVVFGPHIDTDSAYVKRVFRDWFPNASFAQHTGENVNFGHSFQTIKTDIWAGVKQTAAAEALDWPASQLPGLPSTYERWGHLMPNARVANLVQFSRRYLQERGTSSSDVDQIERALAPYGLRLGMTAEEVADIRQADEVKAMSSVAFST